MTQALRVSLNRVWAAALPRITCLAALVLICMNLVFVLPSPSFAGEASLFGSAEIRSARLEKFTKWRDMLHRYAEEEPHELDKCVLTATNPCNVTKWRIFLKSLKNLPPRQQLDKVNAYINKWLYVLDPVNYGVNDYWATPRQFMTLNGDCEDYAIAKYVSLEHLGFAVDDLRIVVLQDMNLNIPHAILVVYLNDEALVLDNQISNVVDASRIRHYKPIYSINEHAWWLHRS